MTIKKLEFFDKGFVQCTANNGVDKITSHSHLIVNPETQTWGKFSLMIDIIFYLGYLATLSCRKHRSKRAQFWKCRFRKVSKYILTPKLDDQVYTRNILVWTEHHIKRLFHFDSNIKLTVSKL